MVDGKKYCFSPDGKMAKSSWIESEGKTYYFGPDGVMATGLTNIGDDTYCFGSDGQYVTGRLVVDDKKYLFGTDGKMAKSVWYEDGGKKYYFGADGQMAAGLTEIDGDTYCFSAETGQMVTGRLIVDDKKYLFGEDGKMAKSKWYVDGEKKYYLGEDGQMASGLTEIDGATYYFSEENGQMMTGRIKIGDKKYLFGTDGKMMTGWQKIDDIWYFFNTDGTMATGWIEDGGKKYYLYPETGAMAKNVVIDDLNLLGDGSAAPLSDTQIRAKSIIASIGSSPQAIYNYVRSNNVYKYMEATRSLDDIQNTGWSYFANYSMDNRYVVCYYFAAITDILFKQAGYQSRIVYGTGAYYSEHYWNQVLVNGQWLNYDTCNGFSGRTEEYLKTPNNQNDAYNYTTGKGYTVTSYIIARYY